MPTFRGVVAEFPDIRIDYFRTIPDRVPPLACFLSHVHSDHLQGLESMKAPFVYCSSSTRELLLCIEKYPHRMNFAKGILEVRRQHYRHLRMLLVSRASEALWFQYLITSETNSIEYANRDRAEAQLRDQGNTANHCPGAVMFLIEDNNKAIMYTGDIRAEPWWVNSIARQPAVIPYANRLRTLDKVYLDTTFAVNEDPYRTFPAKAQGLSELLAEVSRFPDNTVFHFNAWTLGYEEVWVALAARLKSQIHVDDYKWRLYSTLATSSSIEGAALCGFHVGNHHQPGYLTKDDSVRLHSCEYRTRCRTLETSANIVWITPSISRSEEGIIPEFGAGGCGGDFIRSHEIELDDYQTKDELIELCKNYIPDDVRLDQIIHLVEDASSSRMKAIALNQPGVSITEEAIPLKSLANLLSNFAKQEYGFKTSPAFPRRALYAAPVLRPWNSEEESSTRLYFPYFRHSSYNELCHFLSVFKPLDIHPCVTDGEYWTSSIYIEKLFGQLCSDSRFSYDDAVRAAKAKSGRPSCENSSPQDTHVRLEPTLPKHVLPGLDSVLDSTPGLSVPGAFTSVGSKISRIKLSSSGSNQGRGTSRPSSRIEAQTMPQIRTHKSRKDQVDQVITGSHSVWLDSPDIDFNYKRRLITDLMEDLNSITHLHGESASASLGGIPVGCEDGRIPPFDWPIQLQKKLSYWDESLRRPEASHTGHPLTIPLDKNICTEIKPRFPGGGKQTFLNETPGNPESEAEAGLEGNPRMRSEKAVGRETNISPDPETQLSVVQSGYGLRDLGSAELVSTSSLDAHRVQHRKYVYEVVARDDGYAWGSDCVLFSAIRERENKEVEI